MKEATHKLNPEFWKTVEDEAKIKKSKLCGIVIKSLPLCQESG